MGVRWRAFPLHPNTPEEGLSLEELFKNYPVNVDEIKSRSKKKAAELNLPFGDRTRTYNSRLSQEMGLWAESKGRGDQFHMAAFRAYFVHGRNIAKIPVILGLTAEAGLPRDEAETVISERAFRDRVDEDWAISRARGITAVPTFMIEQDKLVGAQPYETLERFLVEHGIGKAGGAGN